MHNHIGKMLPTVPDMDTQLALSAKMIDKRTSTPKGSHGYSSYYTEYALMAEFQLLQQQRLPGIYCLPSYSSPLTWWAVLFIRQGPYRGAVLRFRILLPENYPDGDVPKVEFDGPVFHPFVDIETNQLNVKQGFKKWKRNVNHLWQLLLYIRRSFYKVEVPNIELASNKEAARLWEEDKPLFEAEAEKCVKDWETRRYNTTSDDPHYIRFSQFEESVHTPALKEMKAGGDGEGSGGASREGDHLRARKSFMKPGSMEIFSDMMREVTGIENSLPNQ